MKRAKLSAAVLSAYVDGDLGWWRRRRIHRHLSSCEPCRRYVEQIAAISGSTRRSEHPSLSPQVKAELQRAYSRWAAAR